MTTLIPVIADNLDRASLGGSYTNVYPNVGSLALTGNDRLYGTVAGGEACVYRHTTALNNDQYAEIELATLDLTFGGNYSIGCAIRVATGVDAARSYYLVRILSTTPATTQLIKVVAGSETSIASSTSITWSVTDKLGLMMVGTTITAMKNRVSLGGSFSTTDASLASGFAGPAGSGAATTMEADAFEAGIVVNAPATLSSPTPSGTLLTQSGATISATTDQGLGTLYVVVDSSANLSGVTAAQIKAGQKANSTAALASGNVTVTAADLTPDVIVSGLSPSTAYAYAIVQNNAEGDSNVVTGTFTTADPSLEVTTVDSDNVITSTQTNATLTGIAIDSARIEIRQGNYPVVMPQSVDSQNSTSMQFDVVFEGSAGSEEDLKYGAATLHVINADGERATKAITIAAPSGVAYVNLTSVNATAGFRITAVADLAAGDQLEISNVDGGSASDINVNADATFDVDEDVVSFDVRAWSALDKIWGAPGTQTVGTDSIELVVADASHSHSVDNLTLTQANVLAVAEASHAHSVDSPTLSQANTLAVADATHAHDADNVTLTVSVTLTVADAAHDHTVDSPTLTQAHVLAVAGSAHAHSVDSPTLTQANTLVVADAAHDHSADNVTLTQALTLTVADASHDHSVDSPTLTQSNQLAVADAAHAHTADNLALTQANQLVVADASHEHAVDNVTLSQGNTLSVADATHDHTVDNVALSQANTLAVADSSHAHAADNVSLTQAHVLAVADAVHEHSADNITLNVGLSLAVADSTHAHAADTPSLTQAGTLSVSDATHAHTVDTLGLIQASTIVVADASHAHTADNITTSNTIAIVVADALHGHLADNLALTQAHLLAVADALHAHGVDAVLLVQANTLAVSDALHAHSADQITLRLPAEFLDPSVLSSVAFESKLFSAQRSERLFIVQKPNTVH